MAAAHRILHTAHVTCRRGDGALRNRQRCRGRPGPIFGNTGSTRETTRRPAIGTRRALAPGMAWMFRVPALLALALVGTAPLTARAISEDCSDPSGMCTVSNDGQDFTSCMCAGGDGGAGGGGNEWAGLDAAALQLECQEQLALFCGPPLPPDGISCETREGMCTVDNDGGDSVFCTCDGQPDSGTTGGNDWAGLDDDQLYEVCLDMVEDFCAPEPGTGTDPTGMDTGDPTDGNTGTGGVATSGETEGGDSGTSGESGGASDTGGAATEDTGEPNGSSSDGTGGSGDASTGSDASATAGDASATAGDASATAGDASATAGESGDTDSGPSQDITQSGCGCSTRDAGEDMGGWLALALGLQLGAVGRRRRR
jgi:MYXO-CTERM domain-containing protein